MVHVTGQRLFSIPALCVAIGLAWHPLMANPRADAIALESEVLDMGLEDLLDVQVTSVSKRPQSRWRDQVQ